MSETIKRRINLVIEMTWEKTTIDKLRKREVLNACMLAMLKTVKTFVNSPDNDTWQVGVVTTPSKELISYNWFVTDAEAYMDEDDVPDGATRQ